MNKKNIEFLFDFLPQRDNPREFFIKWAISKVLCVIMDSDNASANNSTISYLARALCVWNEHTLLNGEFMHMRCSVHILNDVEWRIHAYVKCKK